MSRFVDLDRVDIRLLGHDRVDPSRKVESQYASADFVRAANDHLKTCRPVEES